MNSLKGFERIQEKAQVDVIVGSNSTDLFVSVQSTKYKDWVRICNVLFTF